MAITEVFGGSCLLYGLTRVIVVHPIFTEFRTGKTQLSHTLCGKLVLVIIYLL